MPEYSISTWTCLLQLLQVQHLVWCCWLGMNCRRVASCGVSVASSRGPWAQRIRRSADTEGDANSCIPNSQHHFANSDCCHDECGHREAAGDELEGYLAVQSRPVLASCGELRSSACICEQLEQCHDHLPELAEEDQWAQVPLTPACHCPVTVRRGACRASPDAQINTVLVSRERCACQASRDMCVLGNGVAGRAESTANGNHAGHLTGYCDDALPKRVLLLGAKCRNEILRNGNCREGCGKHC